MTTKQRSIEQRVREAADFATRATSRDEWLERCNELGLTVGQREAAQRLADASRVERSTLTRRYGGRAARG